MKLPEISAKIASKIRFWKGEFDRNIKMWHIKYVPEPVYWIYLTIEFEIIVLIYAGGVLAIPTYLASLGKLVISLVVAVTCFAIARLLLNRRELRKRKELKRELKREIFDDPRIKS